MRPWMPACLALALLQGAELSALSRADAHVQTAQKLLRRGRDKDARLELQAALALEPGRADVRELLAGLDPGAAAPAVLLGTGMDQALAARVEAPLARGRSAYKASDLRAAAAAFQEALRLDPGQAEARQSLERLNEEAYQSDPDQPFDRAVADLYEEGLREMRKGRLVEARRKLEEAKALNPAQPQLLRALAWVADGAARQQGSRDAADLVLEGQRHLAEQEDAKAAEAFGAALAASPGLRAAQAGLDQVRRRNAGKVGAAVEQGSRAFEAGDWSAAIRGFELALSLDPLENRARHGLAQARAQQQSRRSAALQRREADRLYNAGVEAWQAGDLAQAAARFREALAMAPDDAESAKALEAVRRRLEERADKDRQDAARLLEEGRTLERRGALEEALRRYERALGKDPAQAEALAAKRNLEGRLRTP